MANEYTNDINIKNTISLRDILAELPSYVKVVFRGIEKKASSRTRLGYAIDIKTFYKFLLFFQMPIYTLITPSTIHSIIIPQ